MKGPSGTRLLQPGEEKALGHPRAAFSCLQADRSLTRQRQALSWWLDDRQQAQAETRQVQTGDKGKSFSLPGQCSSGAGCPEKL